MRGNTPDEEEEEIEAVLPAPRSRVASSTSAGTRQGSSARNGFSASSGRQGSAAQLSRREQEPRGESFLSGSSLRKTDKGKGKETSVNANGKRGRQAKGDESDDDLASISGSSSVIEVSSFRHSHSASAHSLTHGPLKPEPILVDDLFPSSPSSSSSSRPRASRYIGAPYVDIPLLPLHQIRKYSKPANCRYPTSLSRNDQIQFKQTPPPSSPEDPDVSFVKLLSGLPLRSNRAGMKSKKSTWVAGSDSESSSDLGGYGSATSSSDGSEGSEESDMPTMRGTRSKVKGRETLPERAARSGGRVSADPTVSYSQGRAMSKNHPPAHVTTPCKVLTDLTARHTSSGTRTRRLLKIIRLSRDSIYANQWHSLSQNHLCK